MPPPGLLKRPSFMKTIDMKRIVILLVLLLPAVSFAQDFQVYSVKGAVTVKNGASPEAVTPGMTLKANSLLDIPADARIVVLLESKKELHTLKGPAVDQVGNLVKKEGFQPPVRRRPFSYCLKRPGDGRNMRVLA